MINRVYTSPMLRSIFTALGLCLLFAAQEVGAFRATDLPVVAPGQFSLYGLGGPIRLDRTWKLGVGAGVRVGVAERLELASPLAVGFRLIDAGPGSAILVGIGITDLHFTGDRHLLWTPAVALSAQARIGPESMLRISVDLTGVERGWAKGAHPVWFRSAAALVVDVGPWVTVAMGVAFQRLAFGEGAPDGAAEAGWVGNARLSLGAVAAHPLAELPTLAVVITDHFQLIGLYRLDINTDIDTTDTRLLFGFEINR